MKNVWRFTPFKDGGFPMKNMSAMELAEKVLTLPKWVQDYICDLDRCRAEAETALKEFKDSQTPSAFYTDDIVKNYIQARSVYCTHAGMEIQICAFKEGHIKLFMNACKGMGDVAIMPESGNVVSLVLADRNGGIQ